MSNPNNVGSPVGAYPLAPSDSVGECDETNRIPTDDLIALAGGVASITVDGQTVTERPVQDVIAIDKYIASRRAGCAANGNGWGMVGKAKVVPPSSTGC